MARADGPAAFGAARDAYGRLPEGATTGGVVDRVLARRYAWGESNGT
jgi:hypothetical protein